MAREHTRLVRGGMLAASALLISGFGLISACGSIADARTGPREPEKIYDSTCGYCHGHNVGPIIKGRNLPPEAIEYFVRHGSGAMPAFRPTEITPDELAALANWISASKEDETEHGQ